MSDRPATIRRTPGYLLGRLHAYRDRGAGYVDGFRTSLQAGVLVAGVAFGAKFTESAQALWLGGAVTLGLEVLKVLGGWLDHRWQVWHTQNLLVGIEVNPVSRWNLELLEEIARRLGAHQSWIDDRRGRLGLDGRRAERVAWDRLPFEPSLGRGPDGPPPRPNPVPK